MHLEDLSGVSFTGNTIEFCGVVGAGLSGSELSQSSSGTELREEDEGGRSRDSGMRGRKGASAKEKKPSSSPVVNGLFICDVSADVKKAVCPFKALHSSVSTHAGPSKLGTPTISRTSSDPNRCKSSAMAGRLLAVQPCLQFPTYPAAAAAIRPLDT